MSRMTTSFASFSWARPAMRRAISSGVRSVPDPFLPMAPSVPPVSAILVEAAARDQLGDGRRHEAVERLAAGGARPEGAGGDRYRLNLEELHAPGPPQLPQAR